jgi:hypothetical protein
MLGLDFADQGERPGDAERVTDAKNDDFEILGVPVGDGRS